MKLGLFYHCRIRNEDPKIEPTPALEIVAEQARSVLKCGILGQHPHCEGGVNGDEVDAAMVRDTLPEAFTIHCYGPESKGEFPTLERLWLYCRKNPDAIVCYFHSKGVTRIGHRHWTAWRRCMTHAILTNWKTCVLAISENKYDMAGAHWLRPRVHNLCPMFWGGNFWWVRASYVNQLPSPMEVRNTRYDAEVWLTRHRHARGYDLAPHFPGAHCMKYENTY